MVGYQSGQCLLKKSRSQNTFLGHPFIYRRSGYLDFLQALKRRMHLVHQLLVEEDNQKAACPICLEPLVPGEQVRLSSLSRTCEWFEDLPAKYPNSLSFV